MSIVWLASYPKSGNTWLRAVLTSYVREEGRPASINALIGQSVIDRDVFDDYIGIPSADLTCDEILRLKPLLYELLAAEWPRPAFVKVHDACVRTPVGPLFPRSATAAAVYLVRNPLDVAVSYAHHMQFPIDEAVAALNRPVVAAVSRRGMTSVLPQWYLTWSRNVSSWLEAELPVRVVRYEDMLEDPAAAFGAIVRHAGLEWNPARLARAVDQARFDRLRAQERKEGFSERQPTAPSFFRSGTAGGWRTALTPALVRSVVDAHAPVMERFGYLREAEAFLSAGGGAARTPAAS